MDIYDLINKLAMLDQCLNIKAQVSDDKIIDLEGQVVVPGFIDVHSHGGYSFDSMDGDANQIDEMVNDMVHEGITTYFATTMTQSHENIAHAMVGIKEAAAKKSSYSRYSS